jgi:HEAT repeat protein
MTELAKNTFTFSSEIPPSFEGAPFLAAYAMAYAASDAGKFIDAVRSVPVIVAVVDLHPTQKLPSVPELQSMAVSNPHRLVLLASSELAADPVWLSQAAEAMGHTAGDDQVLNFLLGLFRHARPFVREAALYGLAPFLDRSNEARAAVELLSKVDHSPGVREAAAEVLMLL